MRALGKIFGSIGGMADEACARDAWKLARNAVGEKAGVMQAGAIQVNLDTMKTRDGGRGSGWKVFYGG